MSAGWTSYLGCFVLVVSCAPRSKFIECTSNAVCDRRADGICTLYAPTGHHWCTYTDLTCDSERRWSDLDVGDGLAGMCMDAPDGGAEADASPADAINDGAQDGLPPVTTYQAANLVLGQPDYESAASNYGGLSAISVYSPTDIEAAAGRFLVADSANARVLAYDFPPVNIQQPADIVIGQADFESRQAQVTQDRLSSASGLCSDGNRLVVTDSIPNRVLIWNTLPDANGAPADLVLGQPNFTTALAGTGAGNLDGPGQCWTDGDRLIVSDSSNNRVLVWNTFPIVNQQPADVVLGWSDFGYGADDLVVNPPTAASMNRPRGVYFDGTRLFVADAYNHRILVWTGIPTENGTPADYVIGQADSTTNAPDRGLGYANAGGVREPSGITAAFGSLFVADRLNNRVLVFTPVPSSSGATADAVLGQMDFEMTDSAASQRRLLAPWGVAVVGETFWVADRSHNRVLRYGLSP